MFPALKKALLPAVLTALLLGAASQLQTETANADLEGTTAGDGVWFLQNYSPGGATSCDAGNLRGVRLFGAGDVSHIDENDGILVNGQRQDPIVQLGADDELIMCVEPRGDNANVIFTTSGAGIWTNARCLNLGNNCLDEEGVGSGTLTVVATGNPNDLDLIAITFSCEFAGSQTIRIIQDDEDDDIRFTIMCKGNPASMAIFVSPTRVESSPALGNSSIALIRAEVTDASGQPVLPGTTADITVSRCALSSDAVDTPEERDYAVGLFDDFKELPQKYFDDVDALGALFGPEGPALTVTLVEVDTNQPKDGVPNHSEVLALFHAEGCEPGPVTVTIRIENERDDLEVTATITVVGPPAFITISASPTTLVCGEKSEITVSVTDKLNQLVSDHTFIEVVTNWGGVLGGTGSSLVNGGPVDPVSNTTITLLNGVGKAYLITSDTHIGQYEVLAASTASFFGRNLENHPPVVAQVTVTCTKGTTSVTAPNTGTGTSNVGTIRPPNTGDGGLVAPSGQGGASLLAIAGAVAIALTGFAGLRRARR
jgi:hypothetical protein